MPTFAELYGAPRSPALAALARMNRIAPQREAPPPPPDDEEAALANGLPPVNPSLVSRVGSAAGGGLSAAANVLDLPGSSVRDLLAWENPFDQWWTPTRPDNRTTGRDLARKYGLAGEEDTWGNFGGGLGAEVVLDPLTWTGVGALTKAGTALGKAGLTKTAKSVANETAEKLARSSGKTMGSKKLGAMGAKMRMTPRQVIDGSEDVLDAKRKWLESRGELTMLDTEIERSIWEPLVESKWKGVEKSDDLLDKPLQSILSFRVPGLMKDPLELTRDPAKSKSSLQKFVDKNAVPAPDGFQLPAGVAPAAANATGGSSFMPRRSGSTDPIIEASVRGADDAIGQYGEVWKSENFRKISRRHEAFDGSIAGLVSGGVLKDTDADILRLAFSGASEKGMSILSRPVMRVVDTLDTGVKGQKAAGRWTWQVGDSGMLEFGIELAKDRPATQSGLSVLLHELGHMAQFAYKQKPGNGWGGDLSPLLVRAMKGGRLKEELTGLHGEKLGEYLSGTFDEQFPQLFADSIIRRKVPQGVLGKIVTDVRDWVVQFLEKLKVVRSIPKPTQKKIDSIIDELMGFDKSNAAKPSAWKKVRDESGLETYKSGGMIVTKDGEEWFASYPARNGLTHSSPFGFTSMDEAVRWAESHGGASNKNPAGSFTPGQDFYDKARSAGLDHNQSTLYAARQTGNSKLAKHLEETGSSIPDNILDALDGDGPMKLFDRLKYKDGSGSADMLSGSAVSAAATSAGKKFFDAVQVGKQKVVEQLKDVMDEDLAVVAADGLDSSTRGLYKIPGASAMVALFNASVRGGLNERGRDIGKMTYDNLQKAIEGSRESITPVVRAFEESGLFDENRLVAGGMTPQDAIKTLNERDSLLRQFLEYDPKKMAGKPIPKLPAEMVALTPALNQIRDMLDGILSFEQSAGLNAKELQDKFVSYLMRYRKAPGKHYGHNPSQGSVFEVSHSAHNAREFRDLPGGVATLQAMSLDPKLSGIVELDPVIKGRIEKGDFPELRDHVAKKYGDQLEDGFDSTDFDPDKDTRFDSYIRSMANLDPFHIKEDMPIFGRSLLDDLQRRVEDGVRVSNNAMTVQLLLGKSAIPAEVTLRKVDDAVVNAPAGKTALEAERSVPQSVTINKVLKDLQFEASRAWDNTVSHMSPEAIAQRDGMLTARKADVDALAPGESIILNTIDEGRVKLTRDPAGYITRDVMPLDKSGNPKKGKGATAVKEIVDDDAIKGFIRQEQNSEFLDKFTVDKETHTQATRWLKPFSNPEEVDQILRAMNRFINVTKSSWTAPWPAFHTRNLVSGQVNNAMLGATDPTATGKWAGVMRFFKPLSQANTLRNGETIKGIADEIPLFKGMTDEQATQKLSDLAFKHGITGDKMGLAAEHIGQSQQALRSQMPGLNKEVQPLQGMFDFMRGRFSEGMKKFSPPPAGINGWDAANPLAVRDGIGVGKEGVIHYTDDAFLPARLGRDLSSYVEDLNRLSPFIAYMKQGYNPAEAAKLVKRNQVDYSNLSAFEKKYARLGVPFYAFSRGMLPTVLEELIHNPGGPMGQTVRVLNRSRSDDGLVPDYISDTASIPLGSKPDGTRSFMTGLGLAFEDPLNLMNGVLRGQPEETARNVLARSNPFIKGTVEGVTGRSLYFDGPGGGRELTDLDPPIGRTLSNVRDLATGQRTEDAEPFINNRFEFLMGNSPAARAISMARTLTDPRKVVDRPLDTVVNLATGFRVRDLSPSAQDYAYKEKLAEALKDSGAREFRRSYLPDSRAENLGEDERQLVEQMLQELKVLDKRQKVRREESEAPATEQTPTNQKIRSALFQ